jgi:hypothetical protein
MAKKLPAKTPPHNVAVALTRRAPVSPTLPKYPFAHTAPQIFAGTFPGQKSFKNMGFCLRFFFKL